jgi:hypothetical protein
MNRRATLAALLCSAVLILTIPARGQKIENVRASFADGKAVILYDLTAIKPDQKFEIQIFGSHNNYAVALTRVSGDVGKDVSGGLSKRIEWNAAEELGTFSGDIVFRVRGQLIIAPLAITNPTLNSSYRRGKTAELAWTGGVPTQQTKLEIMQDGKVLQALPSVSNTGSYTWEIPSDFAKGTYTLRVSTGSEQKESSPFKVKAKVPLLLKLSPIILAGIVIAVLPKGKSPKDNTTTDEDLPDAPGPK